MPRLTGSSSSMISIARTFGAPDSVPAGKVALSTSRFDRPGLSVPSTLETMCCTCEYFSIDQLVGDLDAAGFGDAADVVARQVDQHHVFGEFLRIGQQFVRQRRIAAPAWRRAGGCRPAGGS